MTYDTVEESIQSAQPAELYAFVAPAFAFYLTTCAVDVQFGGFTYKATPQARSSLMTVDQATDQSDVTIEIPANHPLAVAYAPGIPVRELAVTITRLHPASGVSLQLWNGFASGMSNTKGTGGGAMASFRIPNGTGDTLDMDIPAVLATRLCNHVLYDDFCTLARGGFTVNATISSISSDGRTITVSTMSGNPTDWATHGELVHTLTTERRTIGSQTGNSIAIQCAFPNGSIHIGDAVQVFAGCDHTLTTCRRKFNNHKNYGGLYFLPSSNVFYVGLVQARYQS